MAQSTSWDAFSDWNNERFGNTTTRAQDTSDIMLGCRDPEQEPSLITSGSNENDATEQSRSAWKGFPFSTFRKFSITDIWLHMWRLRETHQGQLSDYQTISTQEAQFNSSKYVNTDGITKLKINSHGEELFSTFSAYMQGTYQCHWAAFVFPQNNWKTRKWETNLRVQMHWQ